MISYVQILTYCMHILLTLHAPADHLALTMCSFELLKDISINWSQF